MCGIAGILKRTSTLSEHQMQAYVSAMCDKLAHRGPDNSGTWTSSDGQCVLGHRRLSIIDLSAQSHQPMVGKRSGLTFNGEIYNYVELAAQLTAKGVEVNTFSDTHTLLSGLDNSQEQFITYLDGMYSFAYYDEALGSLLLARDPFGEKPLYYTEIKGALFFASEMGAFSVIPEFEGLISKDTLSLYLYLQSPPAPHTIFANVYKVSPGAYRRFSSAYAYPETQYYAPEFSPQDTGATEQSVVAKLEDKLCVSLERRLRSDVSLGAFLSGGIDSSTVVSLITQKFARPIDTYSVGFKDCDKSEHEQAQKIAKKLGTKHHNFMFDTQNYVDFIDVVASSCEPNADTSCIPTYLVSKLAGQEHKVILTGDGGDELFAGYNRYFLTLAAMKGKDSLRQQRQWHLGNEYTNTLNVFPHHQLRLLFGQFPSLLNDTLLAYRRFIDMGQKDPLSLFRQVDLSAYLPTVLSKVDRMSMANSIETRTPFLSTDVFQYAAQIPSRLLFDGNTGKNILRKLLAQYIPETLIQKQKVGFSFIGNNPASEVATRALITRFTDEKASAKSFLATYFDNKSLEQFISSLAICSPSLRLQSLWALLVLNSFLNSCRYKVV